MHADQSFVQHGQIVKEANILESTCDATYQHLIRIQTNCRPASEANVSCCGSIDASDKIKNGCFTSTVWADHTDDLSRPDTEIDILYSGKSAKTLTNLI